MATNDVRCHQALPNLGVKCEDCFKCVKGFTTPEAMELHLEMHSLKLCVVCDVELSSQAELVQHMRQHASEQRTSLTWKCGIGFHRCSQCVYGYASEEELENHVCWLKPLKRRHHHQARIKPGWSGRSAWKKPSEKNGFPCCYCSRTYAYLRNLHDHFRSHSGSSKFSCFQCEKKFLASRLLAKHVCDRMEQVFYCRFCPKSFGSSLSMRRHEDYHSRSDTEEQQIFTCRFCHRRFDSSLSKARHEANHARHGNVKLGFTCRFCSKKFSSSLSKVRHEANHARHDMPPEQGFACRFCPKTFDTSLSKVRHEANHARNDKKLRRLQFFKKYKKEADEERVPMIDDVRGAGVTDLRDEDGRFLCRICPVTFGLAKSRIRHEKIFHNLILTQDKTDGRHREEKSETKKENTLEALDDPKKEILDKNEEFRTILDSTGTKWHVCPVCKKLVRFASKLRTHMLIHADKTFTCSFCPKSFSSDLPRKVHENFHYKRQNGGKDHSSLTKFRGKRIKEGSVEKKVTVERNQLPKLDLDDPNFDVSPYSITSGGVKCYQCDLCRKRLLSRTSVIHHLKIHYGNRPVYPCRFCPKTLTEKCSRVVHERIHMKDKAFQCSYCERYFVTNCSLIDHIRLHTGERPYPCPLCEKRFSTRSTGICHLVSHIKPYSCDLCEEKFARKEMWFSHRARHMRSGECYDRQEEPVGNLTCAVCNQDLESIVALKQHVARHIKKDHSDSSVGVKSEELEEERPSFVPPTFTPLVNKVETQVVRSPQELMTPSVPRVVTPQVIKNETVKNTHSQKKKRISAFSDPSRKYQCPTCLKRFIGTHHLNRHMNIHREDRPLYGCRFCSKKLTEKWSQKYHEEMHLKKRFMCPVCEKCFALNSKLVDHMRVHDTHCLYPCPECGKEFSSREGIRDHMETHRQTPRVFSHVVKKEPGPISNRLPLNGPEMGPKFLTPGKIKREPVDYSNESAEPCPVTSTSDLTKVGVETVTKSTCPTCGMSFDSHFHLMMHKRTHRDDARKAPTVQEAMKGLLLPKKEPLPTQNHHPGPQSSKHEGTESPSGENFSCPVCDRSFDLRIKLNRHLTFVHSGETRHSCSSCGMTCIGLKHLNQHMLIHEDQNIPKDVPKQDLQIPKCVICSEKFPSYEALKEHQRSHEKDGLYSCHLCTNMYATFDKVEAHVVFQHS